MKSDLEIFNSITVIWWKIHSILFHFTYICCCCFSVSERSIQDLPYTTDEQLRKNFGNDINLIGTLPQSSIGSNTQRAFVRSCTIAISDPILQCGDIKGMIQYKEFVLTLNNTDKGTLHVGISVRYSFIRFLR